MCQLYQGQLERYDYEVRLWVQSLVTLLKTPYSSSSTWIASRTHVHNISHNRCVASMQLDSRSANSPCTGADRQKAHQQIGVGKQSKALSFSTCDHTI